MNLLADESIDRQIVARLLQDGHAVVYVAEMSPGISDDDVLREAARRNALLVTADKDFGELVFRQRRIHTGVILLRLSGLSSDSKADIIALSIREQRAEMQGSFTVISQGFVRIRHSHKDGGSFN